MKPYYERDGLVIYHGDVLEVLPTLEPKCVDLVLTDPPYNVGKNFANENLTPEEYEQWTAKWFAATQLICRRAVVFPGHGNLGMWLRSPVIRKPSAVGCWYKTHTGGGSILGLELWEPYLYWGGRVGGRSVEREGTTRPVPGGHPTPKPIGLMEKLLIKMKSERVLDPFMGSGTTLAAAKHLGLQGAIGIEIDERWCEQAAERLDQDVLFSSPLESIGVDLEADTLTEGGDVALYYPDSAVFNEEGTTGESGEPTRSRYTVDNSVPLPFS